MNHVLKLSLLATAIVTTYSQAEEFRQHDAHVHGVVELNIAQDGNELLMEIHAPGADVVGFESAPKGHEQKEQLEKALATLNIADKVMTLSSAAQCKAAFTEVRHTLGDGDHHEEHDHDKHENHDDDHDKHDHDKHENHDDDHDKHDHDKHENHDDDHDKHDHDKHMDEEEGGHGEFIVEYHFECGDIDKLNQINTRWFTHFPSTESIGVNMITEKAQVATELNKNNTKISF